MIIFNQRPMTKKEKIMKIVHRSHEIRYIANAGFFSQAEDNFVQNALLNHAEYRFLPPCLLVNILHRSVTPEIS